MYRNCFKRIIDVTLSVLALIVLSWLYLITALLIKLTSKGPVLFKQDRIGKDGKIFKILKFRSMKVNAEKTGSGVYSGKGDPRVTKIGKFIRTTSIDELPQLINIIKGDMATSAVNKHYQRRYGAYRSQTAADLSSVEVGRIHR